jgi:hypothetical protein
MESWRTQAQFSILNFQLSRSFIILPITAFKDNMPVAPPFFTAESAEVAERTLFIISVSALSAVESLRAAG